MNGHNFRHERGHEDAPPGDRDVDDDEPHRMRRGPGHHAGTSDQHQRGHGGQEHLLGNEDRIHTRRQRVGSDDRGHGGGGTPASFHERATRQGGQQQHQQGHRDDEWERGTDRLTGAGRQADRPGDRNAAGGRRAQQRRGELGRTGPRPRDREGKHPQRPVPEQRHQSPRAGRDRRKNRGERRGEQHGKQRGDRRGDRRGGGGRHQQWGRNERQHEGGHGGGRGHAGASGQGGQRAGRRERDTGRQPGRRSERELRQGEQRHALDRKNQHRQGGGRHEELHVQHHDDDRDRSSGLSRHYGNLHHLDRE